MPSFIFSEKKNSELYLVEIRDLDNLHRQDISLEEQRVVGL